jgi:NADP-dependent 3-hydroxy acid dehydrogenase YdfG
MLQKDTIMRDLTDKVAWITGAGSGIGEAAARQLAAAGMHVVLSGRRESELSRVVDSIGNNASVEPLDVSDKHAVMMSVDTILARYRRIDVLVNNAGVNVPERHWHQLSMDDWDHVVRVDLDGSFYCARAVLPAMMKQKDGLIINVSSWAGRYTSITTGPAYAAAKHALVSMNESLNMELGIHGVRACCICPGEVSTPILDQRPVPVSADDRARMVQPEDCGEIIAFVARMPSHVCINELLVSPTHNRAFAAQARQLYTAEEKPSKFRTRSRD